MIFCALQIRFCSEANVSLSVSLLFVLGECQIKWCTVRIYSLGVLCVCCILCVIILAVLYYRVSCRMGIIGQLPQKITWNCPICVLTINTNNLADTVVSQNIQHSAKLRAGTRNSFLIGHAYGVGQAGGSRIKSVYFVS